MQLAFHHRPFPFLLVSVLGLAVSGAQDRDERILDPRRILLVDLDDLGREYLAEMSSRGVTPEIDRLVSQGLWFENFWAAPTCSPSRARILTGLDAYRHGNLVGEHIYPSSAFAGPCGPWVTAGMPGRRTKRGKFHLVSFPQFPSRIVAGPDGYDEFSGLRGNIKWEGTSYYDWTRWEAHRNGLVSSSQVTSHNTSVTAQEILRDIARGIEFIHGSFQAIHLPYSTPPDNEPPGHVYIQTADGALNRMQMLRHLDYWVGRVVDAARDKGYVVLVSSDNGTDGDGKREFTENGINVPMFVVGRGVRAGVSDRLVSETDLWSTVRFLRGMSAFGAADSWNFADELLPVTPTHPPRETLTCDGFPGLGSAPNGGWTRAIRGPRYKLIDHEVIPPLAPEPDGFYDLLLDPEEKVNLLKMPLTPEQQAALHELRARLPVLQ